MSAQEPHEGKPATISLADEEAVKQIEQEVNPFVEQAFEHKTFFTRLHHFVLTSDAFVVVPGGIGTVLELMMIWQLLQVKHVHDPPLILVGKMWAGLVDWARTQLLNTDPPLANPADVTIPRCVDTSDEAIALVREHHAGWLHASRDPLPAPHQPPRDRPP